MAILVYIQLFLALKSDSVIHAWISSNSSGITEYGLHKIIISYNSRSPAIAFTTPQPFLLSDLVVERQIRNTRCRIFPLPLISV